MPSLVATADNAVAALISVQDLSVYKEHTADTKKRICSVKHLN